MESIISAILAGAVTLIGVLIANSRSQAVTDTKLEELTREVREPSRQAASISASVALGRACQIGRASCRERV